MLSAVSGKHLTAHCATIAPARLKPPSTIPPGIRQAAATSTPDQPRGCNLGVRSGKLVRVYTAEDLERIASAKPRERWLAKHPGRCARWCEPGRPTSMLMIGEVATKLGDADHTPAHGRGGRNPKAKLGEPAVLLSPEAEKGLHK
jgi:hypothetical protein